MTFSVSNSASSCADPMSSMSRDSTARAIVETCGSRSLGGFDDKKRATMEEGDCRAGQDLMATCHDVWMGHGRLPIRRVCPGTVRCRHSGRHLPYEPAGE